MFFLHSLQKGIIDSCIDILQSDVVLPSVNLSFINVIYSRYLWKTTRLFSLCNYRKTIYDGDNCGNRWMADLFFFFHTQTHHSHVLKSKSLKWGILITDWFYSTSDSTLRSKSVSLKFYYIIRDDKSRGPYHRHSFFESHSDVQIDTNNLHPIYMQAALVASLCIWI